MLPFDLSLPVTYAAYHDDIICMPCDESCHFVLLVDVLYDMTFCSVLKGT
jgi:hypothetical protein